LYDDRRVSTIYEAAGGMEVFVRLAEATHQRCLADPLLHHPFSHADNQPDHTDRLAAYWAEALGGPRTYTTTMGGSESHVQRLHAGEGDYAVEAGPRFVQCVVASFDEAGVPDDPRVRRAMTDYVTWAATGPFQAWGRSKDDVPDDLSLTHWDWDGRTTSGG
jgi:hemoglobin